MFGLEKEKKKNQDFVFDLEKEFSNDQKRRQLKQKVEQRIQRIKETLRSGEEQDEFDRFGLLLHGYNSLLKVMSRFDGKKK